MSIQEPAAAPDGKCGAAGCKRKALYRLLLGHHMTGSISYVFTCVEHLAEIKRLQPTPIRRVEFADPENRKWVGP